MAYSAVYSPIAKVDIKKAITYYQENASKTIAKKFYSGIKLSVSQICKNPYYKVFYKENRGFVMKIFPYIIFYTINENRKLIFIKSVFHTSQGPKKRP